MTPNDKIREETRCIGKPFNWSDSLDGSCGALSVRDELDGRINFMCSEWRLDPGELKLLQKHNGVVVLRIAGQVHPVVSLQVQARAIEATRPPIVTDEVVERVTISGKGPNTPAMMLASKLANRGHAIPIAIVEAALNEVAMPTIPQSLDDHFAEYINRAIQTFDSDPPATDFQRGYLAALKMVREETERWMRPSGGSAQ